MRAMKNYAGHRLSPWLGHLMVSRQETARALLTPGEVMQLPPADEIVMLAGTAPIRARKARYYEDNRFSERILPPPELPGTEELLDDNWSRLPALAQLAGTASLAQQHDDDDPTGAERRHQPELDRVKPVANKEPVANEFELDPGDDADDDAVANRQLTKLMQGVARQVALDPEDGMEL
jgi:type IV secretion system protein VirD4